MNYPKTWRLSDRDMADAVRFCVFKRDFWVGRQKRMGSTCGPEIASFFWSWIARHGLPPADTELTAKVCDAVQDALKKRSAAATVKAELASGRVGERKNG